MKNKYFVIFLIFLLSIFTVNATNNYTSNLYNIERCYDNINIRIYPLDMPSYELANCSNIQLNDWVCPCTNNISILTPSNHTSRFSALIQYYIDKPQIINGSISETTYNENIKRIVTVKDKIIDPFNNTSVDNALSENTTINNLLLIFVLICAGITLLVLIIYILIFLVFSDSIKKWLGLSEDDKMTLGMILKKIFSREDITRKQFTREKNKIIPIIKEEKTRVTVKEEKKTNYEDEVKKILEGL